MAPTVHVEDFAALYEEWEAILPSCSTNTIFVTPWWQQTWWRHFGHGHELILLSVRDNGSVQGIAPLMLKDGVLGFLGGDDLVDYHDFLVPEGNEAAFYGALFDYLPALEWDTLELTSLPGKSKALTHVPRHAEYKGYAVEVQEEDMAPVARLPSTWDEYVAGLSRKRRHELRRKLRRLETAGDNRQYICDSPATLPDYMPEFFRLHRASSPEKAEFMTVEREGFFIDVAVELGSRGQFKLSFMELDGVPVATCANLVYLDSYLLYNSGYDPSYSHLSVGLLNKALAIKEAIGARKRNFDFLRGTERYKYDLGGKDQPIYRMAIRR